MSEEVTLAQLAAEIAHLRQQVEITNQRLDMIYGAVTRLADQLTSPQATTSKPAGGSQARPEMSAESMLSPSSMLDALHQYAVKSGLDVSRETVERLKDETQAESATEEE